MSMAMVALGAGTVALGSAYGAVSAKNAATRQAAEENRRRKVANVQNQIRAGYRAGLLNLQQGLFKKNAAQQGFDRSALKGQALGSATANAAAAGTVGPSVDAVLTDITMRVGELTARQEDEVALALHNFDVQKTENEFNRVSGEYEMVSANTPSNGRIFGEALFAGATWGTMQYASANLRLGAGTPGQATGTGAGPGLAPMPSGALTNLRW